MKVNIVCSDKGWIYERFINEFKKHSSHQILVNSKNFDVTHYLPYYEVPNVKPVFPCTAWFSHQESSKQLRQKFIDAGKVVNVAISQSKKYLSILNQNGITNSLQIMPGVDQDKFSLSGKTTTSNKLVVGYIGRHYSSSNRKNPYLLNQIAKLPFVELRATNGNVPEDNMPKFYAELDLVISPSLIEGGPMCITEALAVGVPILCFESVGVVDEFKLGIIKVPYNDTDRFISKLQEIWVNKSYQMWYNKDIRERTREQIEKFTWKNFVNQHDEVWGKL